MTYWPFNFPRHLDYPEISLHQFLIDAARRFPQKCAIRCEDRVLTYGNLLLESTAFAKLLTLHGMKRGDRVMIVLWNVPEFAIAF